MPMVVQIGLGVCALLHAIAHQATDFKIMASLLELIRDSICLSRSCHLVLSRDGKHK